MAHATRTRRVALFSTVATATLVACPAVGQIAGATASPVSAPSQQDDTDDPSGGDIIVTANRRSQSANDVGASISSLQGGELLQRGVTSVSDLARIVPGFAAAETGFNVPIYSVRGVGFNDPSLASNATVAVSVDEVPLPYTATTQGAVLDLERLEVLKGPQGTLYGQNATGGAINYIAAKPTSTFTAGGQFGYGRFNTFNGEAYISGPLSNTLKARVAVSGTHGDAWQRSYTRNDDLGRSRKAAARFQLDWEPTDDLKVDFIANGWYDGSDTSAAQFVGLRAQVPVNIVRLPQVFSYPFTPRNARSADWAPGRDYSRDDKFYQFALKIGYDISDDVQLSSISSYSNYSTHGYSDRDGMVPDNFNVETDGTIKSYYTEVRLNGKTDWLTWSVGGNYRTDRIYDQQLTDIGEATNSYSAGFHFDTPKVFSNQKVETFAFFGDGELKLSRQLSVVGGVRYTKDMRDFAGCTADNGVGDTAALYTFLSTLFRTRAGLAPVAPAVAGQCTTLSTGAFIPGIVTNNLVEDNVSFRGGLNFKPSPGSLLYASFSRGFKAGSFPTLGAAFAIGYGPATQERLDAIEAGFKTTFIDRRVHLNGALFSYDYRDKQLRGRIIDPVAGSLSKLVNIPKSMIQGAELELTVNPVKGLHFYGSVSYLKTEVKQFTGINLFAVTENFAGQTLNYAPPWSINAGGEYRWGVSDRLNVFLGADAAHRSRTSAFLGRDRELDIREYTTLDVRAGVEAADGRWSASIWGNNVTNEYYWTTATRGSDTINRIAAKPVTYGVLFRFKY